MRGPGLDPQYQRRRKGEREGGREEKEEGREGGIVSLFTKKISCFKILTCISNSLTTLGKVAANT
jgi:hypothetical protein